MNVQVCDVTLHGNLERWNSISFISVISLNMFLRPRAAWFGASSDGVCITEPVATKDSRTNDFSHAAQVQNWQPSTAGHHGSPSQGHSLLHRPALVPWNCGESLPLSGHVLQFPHSAGASTPPMLQLIILDWENKSLRLLKNFLLCIIMGEILMLNFKWGAAADWWFKVVVVFEKVSEMKAEYFPPREDIILLNEAPSEFYIVVNGSAVSISIWCH